jgi:mono/diheme cytochrome c family protein
MLRKVILPTTIFLCGLLLTLPASSAPEDGYSLYEQYCLTCHGDYGKGDGPAVKVLPSPPANLRISPKLAKLETFAAFLKENKPISSIRKIKHYTSNISQQDLDKLIYYFGILGQVPSHLPARYPNQTYNNSCIYCHGFLADGKGVIQNFRKKPFNFRSRKARLLRPAMWKRKLKASQQKVIYMGKDNPHFFKKLTEEETRALYNTIRNLK